ncbi:MAG: radical SAM protein [Maribacter sp.]|nr:radical SAM protein [Candidatus Brocadiaceae bacterium]MCP4978487.1 radical SAM protein [Maribacter sp.]
MNVNQKYVWNHEKQIERFNHLGMPEQLTVELSNHCNLDCLKCNYSDLKRRKGLMSRELFLKIINDNTIDKIDRLGLSNMGEPLMHPEVCEYINLANKTGKFGRIHFATNAVLLDEGMSNRLLDAGLGAVKLSLDFVDRKNYLKLNKRDHFDAVEKNIKTFCKIKKHGNYDCNTMLKVTLYEYTDEIAEGLIQRWKEHVDFIRISKVHSWVGGDIGNLSSGIRSIPCQYLFCTLHILWDGRVTLCCYDKEGYLSVGTIRDYSIYDIWNNHSKLNAIRQKHLKLDFSNLKMCEFCDSERYVDIVRYPE